MGLNSELDDLPMPQTDPEAIATIVDIIKELLATDLTVEDEYGTRGLQPSDIAVGVTHRDQRDHVRTGLRDARTRTGVPVDDVVVDTANVLQGREFEIVVVWHPLSGRRDASEFHLDAGRLCVPRADTDKPASSSPGAGSATSSPVMLRRNPYGWRDGASFGRMARPPHGARPSHATRSLSGGNSFPRAASCDLARVLL